MNLGLNFKFHPDLDISVQKLKKFPTYYKLFYKTWCLHLTSSPDLPSTIASQALWYNKHIKTDNKSTYLSEISEKGLNCAGHLYNESHNLET